MSSHAGKPAATHQELALQFLERYGQFIRDLALSDKFEVLASMPEFVSFVADTDALFEAGLGEIHSDSAASSQNRPMS